uniref:Pepdidase_M14_N domain-containing protein n=1 Tax=Mesocestoides corti TaxID=53468 RepID=A0A5K3EM76_MESCO
MNTMPPVTSVSRTNKGLNRLKSRRKSTKKNHSRSKNASISNDLPAVVGSAINGNNAKFPNRDQQKPTPAPSLATQKQKTPNPLLRDLGKIATANNSEGVLDGQERRKEYKMYEKCTESIDVEDDEEEEDEEEEEEDEDDEEMLDGDSSDFTTPDLVDQINELGTTFGLVELMESHGKFFPEWDDVPSIGHSRLPKGSTVNTSKDSIFEYAI